MHVDDWLDEFRPSDPINAMQQRAAIDDWLNGSHLSAQDALEELVQLGSRAEGLLLQKLKGASAPTVALVLDGLRRIGSDRLDATVETLMGSVSEQIRMAGARAAQRLNDRAARPILARALRDSSVRLRRRLALWLTWRDEPWAVDMLWDLAKDTDPTVKWAALDALVWHDGAEVKLRVRRLKPEEAVYSRRTAALATLYAGAPSKAARKEQEQSPEAQGTSEDWRTDEAEPELPPPTRGEESEEAELVLRVPVSRNVRESSHANGEFRTHGDVVKKS